ncbi:small-conductance mechanosensitive channel MscS [Budvicia diplopodorum]|uniref:small-conductance mechanosensitive channel MscS n=1 Tax=Budvicia diplopodorum TaxID=1119056 RepID=UPI00135999DA|nr:small-conductance mechanosensitive channel MscS [Budvicia diplopodorum]
MNNTAIEHHFTQFETWLSANKNFLIDSVINLAVALAILVIGFILARNVARIAIRVMDARSIDATVSRFISALVRYAVITFTIIAALGHVGVQTASVIAVLGAAGLAVGLALQGSLANFAAGVILVTFRPFRVGEFITFGAVSGTITSIQIFSTTMTTADGKMVVVPNGKVIAGEIINFSREPHRRLDMIINVGHDSDIDRVKVTLNDVINKEPRIVKPLGITVRLHEMAASSLSFTVRVWVKNGDFSEVNFDLLENFKRALDAGQIKLS